MNQRLLRFYLGTEPDHRGRLLREMLQQDDHWMEVTHDFIQWWFPLAELSRASREAPLVDKATAAAFCNDDILRAHLRAAVSRWVKFLGLRFDGSALTTAAAWSLRRSEWFTEHTHNSLRITRVLKSMRLLGLERDARAMEAGLRHLCDTEPDCGITNESRRHWADALN